MNKQGSGISLFVYLFVLVIAVIGIIIQSDPTADTDRLSSNLKNNMSIIQNLSALQVSDNNHPIENMVLKFVDALVYVAIETTKFAVDYAVTHPDRNWQLIFFLVILAIFSPILLSLTKLVVIVVIFIRDYRRSRREKKELRELRMLREKEEQNE